MASEHERIAEIRRRLAATAPRGSGVELSIGDDAAVLGASALGSVLSVDAQVEGVHFDRSWLSMRELGARAMASALSDLAAMGAEPRAALVSIICPAALGDEDLYAIMDGAGDAQARYACPIAGGNLARGAQLSITTTVIGAAPPRPLTRSGARAGDGLFVTGVLGSAALGLALLKSGQVARAAEHVARWRVPVARIAEGRRAAEHAHAAIDVSDGLLQDLGHLCAASAVGCEVELGALPMPSERALAGELGLDLERLALCGGEDYELLIASAAPPASADFARIGTFSEAPGLRLREPSGAVRPAEAAGFDHFGQGPK